MKRILKLVIGWLITVLALTVAIFLISALYTVYRFDGNAKFPVECAVVFGSAVHNGKYPGPGIKRRVETAVHLAKEGRVEKLIFTGGLGKGNDLSEASVMKNEALRLGADPEIIKTEEGATSTWQSVKFVQPFVKNCKSVVAVSDRYHLARILLLSKKQNLDWDVHPADKITSVLFELQMIAREAVGNLFYLFLVSE
jgi:vancomycin permeability regulator SanA